jgi:Flp pilus assembly protein TadG
MTSAAVHRALRAADGQATVELVALLPLLLVAALAGAAILAGHTAAEQAGQAAQAGAMALLQGGDPRAAARRALPRDADAHIDVAARRVTVRVRPDLPLGALERPVTARVTARAGAP